MKFKVGDRVKALKSLLGKGEIVKAEKPDFYNVRFEGYKYESVKDYHSMHESEIDFIILEPKPEVKPEGGLKFDNNKPDLSILSVTALSEIAKAFEFGAKKYGRYNYRKGMEWSRIGAACLRHTYAWLWGEDHDPESGLHHLAHAGACIVMLLDYVMLNLGTDNRYKK